MFQNPQCSTPPWERMMWLCHDCIHGFLLIFDGVVRTENENLRPTADHVRASTLTADFRCREPATQPFTAPLNPTKQPVTGISNTRHTETLCKSCWRDPGESSTWVLCYLGWPANPKLSNIRTKARLLPRKSHQRRSAAELTAWKRCQLCRKRLRAGQMTLVRINWWTGMLLQQQQKLPPAPAAVSVKAKPAVICSRSTRALRVHCRCRCFHLFQLLIWQHSECVYKLWVTLQVTASSRLPARVALSPDKSSA